MPFASVWVDDGLIRTFTGVVTTDELIAAVKETSSGAQFESLRYIVNDFSGIDEVQFDNDAFTQVVAQQLAMSARRGDPLLFAIVAASEYDDELRDYVTRVAQLGLPWTINVFHTTDEARDWVSRA